MYAFKTLTTVLVKHSKNGSGLKTGFWLDLGKRAPVGAFAVGGPVPARLVVLVVSNGVNIWVTMVDPGISKEQSPRN